MLRHGVRRVWVVDPEDETVYAYPPEGEAAIFKPGDTLTGDDVLLGLSLPVSDIFAQLQR